MNAACPCTPMAESFLRALWQSSLTNVYAIFDSDNDILDEAKKGNGKTMKMKPVLMNDDVKRIAAAAETYALARRWPVTIVILDDGGHLLHLQRLDGATPSSVEMAIAKGRTAALGRRESKVYEDIVMQGRVSFLSAPMAGFLEGGVPIVVDGETVGAVSVSGVKSQEDAEVARAGIAALA